MMRPDPRPGRLLRYPPHPWTSAGRVHSRWGRTRGPCRPADLVAPSSDLAAALRPLVAGSVSPVQRPSRPRGSQGPSSTMVERWGTGKVGAAAPAPRPRHRRRYRARLPRSAARPDMNAPSTASGARGGRRPGGAGGGSRDLDVGAARPTTPSSNGAGPVDDRVVVRLTSVPTYGEPARRGPPLAPLMWRAGSATAAGRTVAARRAGARSAAGPTAAAARAGARSAAARRNCSGCRPRRPTSARRPPAA